jgi:hypothetical protein
MGAGGRAWGEALGCVRARSSSGETLAGRGAPTVERGVYGQKRRKQGPPQGGASKRATTAPVGGKRRLQRPDA